MPENAKTDPDSGVRYYEWQGVDYPSVTSLRKLLGTPHTLVNWIQAQLMDAVINDPVIAEPRKVPTRGKGNFRDEKPAEIRRRIRAAADAKRDAAADLGTRVHEAAERGDVALTADIEVRPFLESYYDFLSQSGAKVLAQEGQVFNLTLGYAGSFDAIYLMPDGRIVCVDLKTGKSIYTDHALQLMGYAMGEFVGRNNVVARDSTALLKSCTDMAVLHLRPTGWEMVYLTVTPELRLRFEQMCGLARWLDANPTIDDLVKEIVTSE